MNDKIDTLYREAVEAVCAYLEEAMRETRDMLGAPRTYTRRVETRRHLERAYRALEDLT